MRHVCGLLLSIVIATAASARDPAGFYGGGYGQPPDFTYTQLEIKKGTDGTLTGTLWQPYTHVGSFPVTNLRVDGARLRFDVAVERDHLIFDIAQTQIGYRGTVTTEGKRSHVAFALRPGPPPAGLLASYEGTYDLGGGKRLMLSRNNDGPGFWYAETPSGRTGFLYNLSDHEFIAGPCFYCVEPVRLRIAFSSSATNGLWLEQGQHKRFVRRDDRMVEEPVTFTSRDGTRLAGTLYSPRSKGPHPAVVMVHGSGGQTRNGFYGSIRFLAEAFARRGIAALAYDKRGTGESKGDFETADLDALADDAAAAVRFLKARPDIDSAKLGLSGLSQAGWIIPMAAAREPSVMLIQVLSGAASLGVEEQERLRLVLQMQAEGYPQSEIDRALEVRSLMDQYAKTGEGWENLAAAFKRVEKEFWAVRFLGGLPARDAPDWPWLRKAFQYDVLPLLRQYPGHVQFFFGQHDTPTPVAAAVPRLQAALRSGASKDWTIRIVPDATHNYYVGRTGGDREFPGLSRYVPRFFEFVPEWVATRFGRP